MPTDVMNLADCATFFTVLLAIVMALMHHPSEEVMERGQDENYSKWAVNRIMDITLVMAALIVLNLAGWILTLILMACSWVHS